MNAPTKPVEQKARELLACPFPHEVKRGPFIERDTEDFFIVRVSCGDCGCAGPYVPIDSRSGLVVEAEAIRLWNTRAALNTDEERIRREGCIMVCANQLPHDCPSKGVG